MTSESCDHREHLSPLQPDSGYQPSEVPGLGGCPGGRGQKAARSGNCLRAARRQTPRPGSHRAMTTKVRVRDTDWEGVRLHVVTGKGGTGKTTVAAALALALASGGRRVLLIEVEGRQGIAQLFDCPPLPYERAQGGGRAGAHRPGGGDVYALAADPEAALLEYLEMFYNLRARGTALTRLGVVDFATTIAPGLRDVLLTGKAAEATRRRGRRRRPSTTRWSWTRRRPAGSAASSTSPPRCPGWPRWGRSAAHADTVPEVISSPADRRALRHGAGGDAGAGDPGRRRRAARRTGGACRPGGIFINMARPAMLGEASWPRPPAARWTSPSSPLGLKAAGISDNRGLAADLMTELKEHALQVALQNRRAGELLTSGRPRYELPLIPDGMDLAGLYRLAAALRSRERPDAVTAPRSWTWTGSSTTGGPGSSSAAGPAAWARPRPRPPSACAPPSAAGRRACSPSTRPGGWPSPWA